MFEHKNIVVRTSVEKTANRRYICRECGETIMPGEEYLFEELESDYREYTKHRVCKDCLTKEAILVEKGIYPDRHEILEKYREFLENSP